MHSDSLKYFEEAGFEIIASTVNLHENNIFENNIETEHERMYIEEGKTIKAIIAKLATIQG